MGNEPKKLPGQRLASDSRPTPGLWTQLDLPEPKTAPSVCISSPTPLLFPQRTSHLQTFTPARGPRERLFRYTSAWFPPSLQPGCCSNAASSEQPSGTTLYGTANLHPPLRCHTFFLALLLPAQIPTMGTLHGAEAPRTWLFYPL